MASEPPERPSDELIARLYEAKHGLPAGQRALSLPDKLRKLLELQKIYYEVSQSRGVELRWWEKPWDIEP
jgi:hypothetical protein